jgi:hypothetical protein
MFSVRPSTDGLGAPRDRYQAEVVVKEWLKKAGAPPKKMWKLGKEEHRTWIFPTKNPTP